LNAKSRWLCIAAFGRPVDRHPQRVGLDADDRLGIIAGRRVGRDQHAAQVRELVTARRERLGDRGRRDHHRSADVVHHVEQILERCVRVAHRDDAARGERREDAPRERRRVRERDVDALLGRQPALDQCTRECPATIGDDGVRPGSLAEPQRDLAAEAFAQPVEQEVVGEVEVVGERGLGHVADGLSRRVPASARPMMVRWISLVPS
jgi:hypothetical protein